MHRLRKFRKIPFLITILLDIVLIFAVFKLMTYVQTLLDSDVRINLTEIVSQNKDVITNKLRLEVNNVELISSQISDRYSQSETQNQDVLKSIFLEYASDKNNADTFLALKDGTAVFPDGLEIDISGRSYFKIALKGTENISERTVSRLNGDDIFVISVPVRYQDEIIGTIQQPYTPEAMYSLCSVSLFSQQGNMYIINSQGYILFSSQQDIYNLESDNYFRILYPNNPEASKKLEADIQNNKAGFMDTIESGQKYFSAYTPIDKVYDWYLITSLETSAVSPNASIVIKLFYIILLVVVFVFEFTLIYFFRMKHKQQQNLERVALVDEVTGGNTFARFMMRIEEMQTVQTNKTYYIFTFDIDNFKYINNFYGFDAGDLILKKIYYDYEKKLLPDECCARIYSDHFVLLLSDASEKRLDTLFQPEFITDGITVYLSAGLYPITSFNESISLMVDKANIAEQKAKGQRKKHVEIYSDEYDEQLIANEQIKRAVEKALDNDEIIPYFQPKVDITTNKLVGAEALARWKTQDGEIILPYKFIPVCEKTGLIEAVDLAVFEKTLQFIRRNLDLNVHCVPISVNLSRYHLMNRDFLTTLLSKLNEYQIPHELIELELTETVIFDNYELIESFISKMHEYGLQVSMDDFGTGYSSLHMLKDIDIDILKIDRGFLMDTVNSRRQRTVFAAIAQMAQALDIKVVVEGVETQENVDMMKDFGCYIAQGFFYSKPMDENLFEKIFQEGRL